MILRIICDCSGMYLRDIYRLVLILNVSMYGDLDLLICKRLKCNDCLRCYDTCIECKDYINTSLGLFRSECGACRNLFAVSQNSLSCFLIHQCSAYGILFARKQVCIGNGINDGGCLVCLGMINLCYCILCSCMDLRNINRLLSILCICMYCKQCSVRIEVFKYNCRSSCQFRRIQCIRQRNSHVM